MKKKLGISVIIIGILVTIMGFVMKRNQPKAIAVIGNADGPTSIFLAGKINEDFTWPIIGIFIIFVGLIVLFVRKKK